MTGFRKSKKQVLFKMQQGKPLASKYLGRFLTEICSKHIQWGLQNKLQKKVEKVIKYVQS